MTKKEEDFNYKIDLDLMRQGAETLRNDDGFSFPDEDEDGLFADNDDDETDQQGPNAGDDSATGEEKTHRSGPLQFDDGDVVR